MGFPFKKVKTKSGVRYRSTKTGRFVPKSEWEPVIKKASNSQKINLIKKGKMDYKFQLTVQNFADKKNISTKQATLLVRRQKVALLRGDKKEFLRLAGSPPV